MINRAFKSICVMLATFSFANASAFADFCPAAKDVKNNVPKNYTREWDDESTQKSITKWEYVEYSSLRERVFCYYATSNNDASIFVYVGNIDDALRRSSGWHEVKFGGGSSWTCNSARDLCEFPNESE